MLGSSNDTFFLNTFDGLGGSNTLEVGIFTTTLCVFKMPLVQVRNHLEKEMLTPTTTTFSASVDLDIALENY